MAKIIMTKHSRLLQTIHDVGIPTDTYQLYDISVAISDAVYNDVVSRYNSDRIKKVYNGIVFDLFRQRKQYNLKKGEPVRLAQLSRLVHEKKGQDILLKALHSIVRDFNFLDFTLDFIGSGESQPYLEKMVSDLELQEQVTFIGEQSREWLFENLSSYHMLVQPSRYEGFGLTILEGFAAGLPVLASNIDGPAEILFDSPAGSLFIDGDYNDCAKKMAVLFDLYYNDKIEDLMIQTLPAIRSKYSIKPCARNYLHLYRNLVKEEVSVN
jgi:glycosyltransferase involved in cell wall biosynthesis